MSSSAAANAEEDDTERCEKHTVSFAAHPPSAVGVVADTHAAAAPNHAQPIPPLPLPNNLSLEQLLARLQIAEAAKTAAEAAKAAAEAQLAAEHAEKAATELELRRKERQILDHGLPKLGRKGPHTSTTTGKASVNKSHELAEGVQQEFRPFDDCAEHHWIVSKGLSSTLWRDFPEDSLSSEWNHEYDIKSRTLVALRDLIAYAGLIGQVHVSEEVSVLTHTDSEKNKQERTDIWVTGSNQHIPSQFPIGVGEVKQPNNSHGGGSTSALAGSVNGNMSHLFGQMYNYLMESRTFFGLRWSFGIITTYAEWRICWLPNADEAAAATSLDAFTALPARPLPAAPPRRIHMSRIFQCNEPDLIKSLIHLLHKMRHTPRDHFPIPLLMVDRHYPEMIGSGWLWRSFTPHSLSYQMPHRNTKTFYLLQNYHGGGDGLVWLAASPKGELVVLKFPRRTSSVPQEEVRDALERECKHWQRVAAGARIVTLDSKLALLMPFAFHARFNANQVTQMDVDGAREAAGNGTFFITFQGPNSWILDEADDQSKDMIEDDATVRDVIQAFLDQHTPLDVARHAIIRLLAAGYTHEDLCWRHVALLPSFEQRSGWEVSPILIDLSRMGEAPADDTQRAQRWLAGERNQPIGFVEKQLDMLRQEHRERLLDTLDALHS